MCLLFLSFFFSAALSRDAPNESRIINVKKITRPNFSWLPVSVVDVVVVDDAVAVAVADAVAVVVVLVVLLALFCVARLGF